MPRQTLRLAAAALAALALSSAGVARGVALQSTGPALPATTPPATTAATTADATADAGVERLRATITAVQGNVRVRSSESAPWVPAAVGMILDENAEFFTAPKSAVRFELPGGHSVTIDRLSKVKLLQAVNAGGKMKTRVGMQYGRTLYDIEGAGREHESSIVTPSATLAVRGTEFVAFDQRPFPAKGISLSGRVEFRDFKKRVFVGGPGAGKTAVTTDNPNAPAFALNQSVVDPGARLARTAAEAQLVSTLLSSGATIGFDYDKGIRVVRGGRVPRTDQELVPTLPGTFNVVLRWQGNTDLNLGVFHIPGDQNQGFSLLPIGGLDETGSGGRIPFDHRGGANGGIEIGYWPGAVPTGAFQFGSVLISGPATQATIDVFRDGQRVEFIGGDGSPTTSAQYTAGPVPPGLNIAGQAVGVVRISPPEAAQKLAPRAAAAAVAAGKKSASAKPPAATPAAAPAAAAAVVRKPTRAKPAPADGVKPASKRR